MSLLLFEDEAEGDSRVVFIKVAPKLQQQIQRCGLVEFEAGHDGDGRGVVPTGPIGDASGVAKWPRLIKAVATTLLPPFPRSPHSPPGKIYGL